MTGAARPVGIIARLRHQIAPVLPRFMRRAGARMLESIEQRRGAAFEIAGQRVRFIKGSSPAVLLPDSDDRTAVDALQLAAFAHAVQAGDVVADVGSYRGTYAVVAAARAGERGRVIAFEPTPANRSVIAANLALNGFADRVVVEPVAVSDQTGTATFYAWGDATTNSLAHTQAEAAGLEVRTVTLDEYFAQTRLPDVVKIDIEGAELLALRGAQKILSAHTRIICELHPYAWSELGYGADDLRALLDRHGRVALDLRTGQEVRDYHYGVVWLTKRDRL